MAQRNRILGVSTGAGFEGGRQAYCHPWDWLASAIGGIGKGRQFRQFQMGVSRQTRLLSGVMIRIGLMMNIRRWFGRIGWSGWNFRYKAN